MDLGAGVGVEHVDRAPDVTAPNHGTFFVVLVAVAGWANQPCSIAMNDIATIRLKAICIMMGDTSRW